MKTRDLDPAAGGMGWTPGCKGCESISRGVKTQVAHSDECRARVIERTGSRPEIAARIKATREREDEWLAKQLETEKDAKKNRVEGQEAPDQVDRGPGEAGPIPSQVGGSSSSSSAQPASVQPGPPPSVEASRKRRAAEDVVLEDPVPVGSQPEGARGSRRDRPEE